MLEPIELVNIERSTRKNKKWAATFLVEDDERQQSYKTIHFGDSRYQDYTMHHDKQRMENYRRRHKSGATADPMTPNALSYTILWGPYTDITRNIESIENTSTCSSI